MIGIVFSLGTALFKQAIDERADVRRIDAAIAAQITAVDVAAREGGCVCGGIGHREQERRDVIAVDLAVAVHLGPSTLAYMK